LAMEADPAGAEALAGEGWRPSPLTEARAILEGRSGEGRDTEG
jgi:hypothetical protein